MDCENAESVDYEQRQGPRTSMYITPPLLALDTLVNITSLNQHAHPDNLIKCIYLFMHYSLFFFNSAATSSAFFV